jgi:hypothetical protein
MATGQLTDYIPQREAMRLLGVSHVTVLRMVTRGTLRRKETPLGWAYSRTEVMALAAQRAEQTAQYGPDSRSWPRQKGSVANA